MTILSLAKAFRVLELVRLSESGRTLTELVNDLGISMGAAQRITNTLSDLGYLSRDHGTKLFRLTPKFLAFDSGYYAQPDLRQIIFPHLRRLNEELNEIVNLGIIIGDTDIIYIDRIDKPSSIRKTSLRVGVRRPIFVNSIGKVILAYLPEAEQERILDRLDGESTPRQNRIKRGDLEAQLAMIRKQGYSANKSELYENIFALAVPILNHRGVAVAGINVVIPEDLVSMKDINRRLIPHLMETGRIISRAMGYVGANQSIKRPRRGKIYD